MKSPDHSFKHLSVWLSLVMLGACDQPSNSTASVPRHIETGPTSVAAGWHSQNHEILTQDLISLAYNQRLENPSGLQLLATVNDTLDLQARSAIDQVCQLRWQPGCSSFEGDSFSPAAGLPVTQWSTHSSDPSCFACHADPHSTNSAHYLPSYAPVTSDWPFESDYRQLPDRFDTQIQNDKHLQSQSY